jgi:MFS family permease
MLLLAASPNLAFAFPVGMLMGAGSIAFMTTSTAIVQTRADAQMRGRVLALQAMVFLGSTPIGGPIVGAICQLWGARSGLVVGGVAALAAAGYGDLAHRRGRDRTREVSPAL